MSIGTVQVKLIHHVQHDDAVLNANEVCGVEGHHWSNESIVLKGIIQSRVEVRGRVMLRTKEKKRKTTSTLVGRLLTRSI